MNQAIKERIIEAVERNTTATIFGFVRLELIRHKAKVPDHVSDQKLKSFLVRQFKNDFTGGLQVK